jgi:ADP-heptose:LPS heptosyltransferase
MAPRYLVIAPQGLGDALEATPLIDALKRSDDRARIDVVALRPATRDLFRGLTPLVEDVIYLPFWESGRLAFMREMLRRRWRKTYDATFLCYPAARPEYHVLSRGFPSRMRVAHRYTEPSLRNALWLHDRLIPVSDDHNVMRNLDLMSVLDIRPERPRSYLLPSAWRSATEIVENRLAIHVGTIKHDGLEARRWPLERFTDVAKRFAEHCEVWVVVGPGEVEESRALMREVPNVRPFEGALPDLARFLGTCRAIVCNDSGVAHLAAAAGTRVISIFGPTPLQHAPFGEHVIAVRPSACPPCFDVRELNTGCALNIDYRCLKDDVPTGLVEEYVRAVMNGPAVLSARPPKETT